MYYSFDIWLLIISSFLSDQLLSIYYIYRAAQFMYVCGFREDPQTREAIFTAFQIMVAKEKHRSNFE